jgi:hypothetical protein
MRELRRSSEPIPSRTLPPCMEIGPGWVGVRRVRTGPWPCRKYFTHEIEFERFCAPVLLYFHIRAPLLSQQICVFWYKADSLHRIRCPFLIGVVNLFGGQGIDGRGVQANWVAEGASDCHRMCGYSASYPYLRKVDCSAFGHASLTQRRRRLPGSRSEVLRTGMESMDRRTAWTRPWRVRAPAPRRARSRAGRRTGSRRGRDSDDSDDSEPARVRVVPAPARRREARISESRP